MYFARAFVMAVYGDYPAVVKSSLSGSACPACFCPQNDFAEAAPQAGWEMRNDDAVRGRKRKYLTLLRSDDAATRKQAKTEARYEGVDLHTRNGWELRAFEEHKWVFGPDPKIDCIFAASPQVTLHGMDEGLVCKLAIAIVEMAIRASPERYATEVCRDIDAYVTRVAAAAPSNSNAELQHRNSFQTFPHGITEYARNKRRIDGSWWISIVRHLHICVCTTSLFFSPPDRKKVARACALCYAVHENLAGPLLKADVGTYQGTIDEFVDILKDLAMPSTASLCRSAPDWTRPY